MEKGSSDNNPLSISSAVRNVADKVGSDDVSAHSYEYIVFTCLQTISCHSIINVCSAKQ